MNSGLSIMPSKRQQRILTIPVVDYIAAGHLAKSEPVYEFHILKEVRDRYQFDETIFSSNGNVIFANFHAARVFAQKINQLRKPGESVRAGDINAMGLIDEIYHVLLRTYEQQMNPGVFGRAVQAMRKDLGSDAFLKVLNEFTTLFPPADVYRGRLTVDQYLKNSTQGKPHIESTLEEIILLHFANINPAFKPFKELFDDEQLRHRTQYSSLIHHLENIFQHEAPAGEGGQYLFDILKAPILASPESLHGQLEFIRKRWGVILSHTFLSRILGSEDFIKEDHKRVFHSDELPPLIVPTYLHIGKHGRDSIEYERYSQDVDWMPRVVLLAKNTYVWLDQLSKKYQRAITKLDHIPDEELDQLARWNITGLWLIGIWERSPASQKIKQLTGNPEAVSSAYSLYEYEIAGDLGGEEAFHHLSHRAWQHGIRLAGDMVPNHMGLFSRWVLEHPEYFIQSAYSPFPNYKFTGPDLSHNPGVQLRVEDGYWNRTDAAVVFQRIDNSNGTIRYIYHGNDGTHMPWNDTAQLNFLKEEVREAVIKTIFQVARKFPIIRFDAAMTLAKKHFQRLWYPHPGSGGDIPSRADYAMTRDEFDRLFPDEFWREVVDRINRDMPGTLLLAEAFWLLEGYFVRTLGMHRVYNSAFMHMLMKEENTKYRELIKNTLAYDPEILKRYVNFMSNPDERTAIDQFGKEGKYFGVAMMMVTLPGLPMFGHGQIEGFTEKYGMEYKKAYYDESPDGDLIRRHEREIFSLLNKRYLFSQVADFELYDFYDEHGRVNENVFAYSNRIENERVLVLYHNKYAECRGWIKQSCDKAVAVPGSAEKQTVTRSVADALQFRNEAGWYYIFREHRTNLEYIRSGKEVHEKGFYTELQAFEYKLFLNFKEVFDSTHEYETLARSLQGNGVPDIQQSLKEMRLRPVHESLAELIRTSAEFLVSNDDHEKDSITGQYHAVINQITKYQSVSFVSSVVDFIQSLMVCKKLIPHLIPGSEKNSKNDSLVIASLLVLQSVLSVSGKEKYGLFNKLQYSNVLNSIFVDNNLSIDPALLVTVLIAHNQDISIIGPDNAGRQLTNLFDYDDIQQYLLVNKHEGILYYNKERFDELVRWIFSMNMAEPLTSSNTAALKKMTNTASVWIKQLKEKSSSSGFRLDALKQMLIQETIDPGDTHTLTKRNS